jgi:pyridoxamine 5'-phosphate oxidase
MKTRAEELRLEWMSEGLLREQLDPDPLHQFEQWYAQAIYSGIPEPNAMTLATVTDFAQPWLRTVLLKIYDERGFVFFTNYHSRKARHIDANARVALLFPWVALGRQVAITGQASRVALTESLRYFATRPRGSQIGAWASPQSDVITSRTVLEMKFMEMKDKFGKGKVPLPSFWGGYRVMPATIEFWQARENRLHDRFLYTRDEGGRWRAERLAP